MRAAPAAVTRQDVLAALDRERARLLAVARDPRAARVRIADWSVRDVIAHCVYWQGMLARMMGAPLPAPTWIPRARDEADVGTDELNRLTVEHYRGAREGLGLDDFAFTADLVRGIVADMKEENLSLPAGAPWDDGTRVHEAIASETHEHWREHADAIEAALR